MGRSYEQFIERPDAAFFGLLGLLFLSIWPLFHSRSAILAAQVSIGVFYALHYALLEAWTGAAVTLLGAVQALTALHQSRRLHAAIYGFLPIPAVVAWLTWTGLPSLLAAAALTLIMVGRMQRDEYRMRIILLLAAPVGMAHDLMVGSLPAFAGGAVAVMIGTVMLLRLSAKDHNGVGLHRSGGGAHTRPLRSAHHLA